MELYLATLGNQNVKLSIFLFISIKSNQSLKGGVIQDAEYEVDVFQNFFYITTQLLCTIAQNPRKLFLTELSCIPLGLDRQLFQCCIDAKYNVNSRTIDVVSSSKRHHVSTWLIQTCNFTKEQLLHVVVKKYKILFYDDGSRMLLNNST